MIKTASEIAEHVLYKIAGHRQSIHGFDDLDKFQELRQPVFEHDKTVGDYNRAKQKALEEAVGKYPSRGDYKNSLIAKMRGDTYDDALNAYKSKRKRFQDQYSANNPEPDYFASEDSREALRDFLTANTVGNFGKYEGVDDMLAGYAYNPLGGDNLIEQGYLPKEDLIKRIEEDQAKGLLTFQDADGYPTLDALRNSPYKYFSSTLQ
jgi:hypothetical protein